MPAIVPKKVRISQEAFDSAVQENVDDFGMDPEEAVEDAVKTFQMQNVDLKGIITKVGGAKSLESHAALQGVRALEAALEPSDKDMDSLVAALKDIALACSSQEPPGGDILAVAGTGGGVEKVLLACDVLMKAENAAGTQQCLETLQALLSEEGNRDLFLSCKGPDTVTCCLKTYFDQASVAGQAAKAVALACIKNEGNKVEFMELKAEEELLKVMQRHVADVAVVEAACSALASFATCDDTRPLASKAFAHARAVAEAGAVEVLLTALKPHKAPDVAATLCNTLSTVAANDKICKQVAELGGVQLILEVLKSPQARQNSVLARSTCNLLRQLAGSDANKDSIVDQGGLELIVATMNTHRNDPTVLQLGLAALAALTLRNPRNAELALKAECADVAVEAMRQHSDSADVQRQACILVRNMAVRNVEIRPLILEKGVEPLLRKAKGSHSQCKDVGAAALRDLGFDDYNS